MTTERTEVTIGNRTTPAVELVYDRDCPNVSDCRNALRLALTEFGAQFGAQLLWGEWDRNSTGTPAEYRSFGSPTVLVNGRDVDALTEAGEPDGNSCRVYANDESGSFSGAPSVQSIVNALRSVVAGVRVTQSGRHSDAHNADAPNADAGVRCAC